MLTIANDGEIQPRTISVHDVISEMVGLLESLLGRQVGLTVGLDVSADVVLIDPSQLRQVIMNLIVNAHDAMPSGGRLTISTRNPTPTSLKLSVKDAGAAWTQRPQHTPSVPPSPPGASPAEPGSG
ncbi:MAG: hypothetical protein U5R31_16835 [Acidimicrobiia bacterium]|nr:hypothetical protein [Acidimicrobiia bacterium]